MKLETITPFLIPLLVIVGGLYLRQKKVEENRPYKKYGTWLIIMGVFLFIIKFI